MKHPKIIDQEVLSMLNALVNAEADKYLDTHQHELDSLFEVHQEIMQIVHFDAFPS